MTTDRDQCIGVIGLGAMGGGIAARLVERGFSVVGYDIDPERNLFATSRGAKIVEGPAAVMQRAAKVICMVDTATQVEDVVLGPDGLISVAGPGDVLLSMSTIALETTLKCSDAMTQVGGELLEAPVSGGPQAASVGKINIFVGASKAAVEMCHPVLEAISNRYFLMGSVGAGFAAKMVNNILFHSTSVAIIEAMVLAVKAGLDPRRTFELLSQSTANSAALQQRVPRFLNREFENPASPLSVAYREMVMETGFARSHGVPTPVASMAEQVYMMGMNHGLGDLDSSSLVKLYEDWTGVRIANSEEA